MAINYKRKISLFIIIFILVFALCSFAVGCDDATDDNTEFRGLVVRYLDVGEGDATFIRLPDGKTMLIDTGLNTKENENLLSSSINAYGGVIDYLVLTHPDEQHVAGANAVINNFTIEKAFVPKLVDGTLYPSLYSTIELMKGKGIETNVSTAFTHFKSIWS